MFDIKLKDGRYFENVCVLDVSLSVWIEYIPLVLDNDDYAMQLYYGNDDNCDKLLAEILSKDIEYMSYSYGYKKI